MKYLICLTIMFLFSCTSPQECYKADTAKQTRKVKKELKQYRKDKCPKVKTY